MKTYKNVINVDHKKYRSHKTLKNVQIVKK